MSDYNTPLPLSIEPDTTLPLTEPCNRPLGPPVHQYPKPSDDNFELHVQTLLLQALSAMSPSGPNATLHISSESQMAPILAGDRQLAPGNCALVLTPLDETTNSMEPLLISDGPVGEDDRIFRKDNDQTRTVPTRKRNLTSNLKLLSPGVTLRRGSSQRSRSPSPTPRERNHGKAYKQKARRSHHPIHDTDENSDTGFCGKFTVSLDSGNDFRYFLIQATPYYPFHPDKHYSNPSGAGHRILPIDTNSSSCRRDRIPDITGKVHVHWYIALNQPAKIGCPLEASPEAWDPRGHRLVPVTDVLESSSEFHNKAQRDLLAKFYLLMYYRHVCQQEGVVSATKVLSRLGIKVSGRPLVLICTFCGQYTDVDWQHIALYDSSTLAQEYIANLGHDPKAGAVRPMHIGMLSVLTCNHIDCKNASRGGLPPRRSSGGRRDDEDLFCQLYTLKLSEGKLQNDMMKIVEAPQDYFPPALGGNMEKLKWQSLDLDDNTLRYLRMETYIDTVLKRYWSNCRVCGEHVQDAEVKDLSNKSMSKFARKGTLCKGPGECTWSEALEITASQLELKLGKRWVTTLERGRALRRGGPPPWPTLIQQKYHSPPQLPSLVLSDDSDAYTGDGSSRSDPMETDADEDEPMREAGVVSGDMDLDESEAVCQIKGARADAQEESMEREENLWLDFIERSGMFAPGEMMDWDE
ncbi:hypothetical protein L211DRAFT_848788 [Terfezia boudieri ATCC MYA-4762]|uniref:Uncharacterized protein n=1 Tax=Terfezia boudieri ATCC MYA-4762 TaxID=1051890 RepID=A0A3N4LV07_9PEZI|nr:hypothetical protein L211DRAFT_848788 [Terfezia boudieri ATCC MYA-4762]